MFCCVVVFVVVGMVFCLFVFAFIIFKQKKPTHTHTHTHYEYSLVISFRLMVVVVVCVAGGAKGNWIFYILALACFVTKPCCLIWVFFFLSFCFVFFWNQIIQSVSPSSMLSVFSFSVIHSFLLKLSCTRVQKCQSVSRFSYINFAIVSWYCWYYVVVFVAIVTVI